MNLHIHIHHHQDPILVDINRKVDQLLERQNDLVELKELTAQINEQTSRLEKGVKASREEESK